MRTLVLLTGLLIVTAFALVAVASLGATVLGWLSVWVTREAKRVGTRG